MKVLTEDQIAMWKRDGFLSPFPLLDRDELRACNQGVARFETWLRGPINGDAAYGIILDPSWALPPPLRPQYLEPSPDRPGFELHSDIRAAIGSGSTCGHARAGRR